MERFVYYKGVHNPDSEHILMVTGQLQYAMHLLNCPLNMYKAIDWKKALAKHLFVTRKFENPSDRLDKVFSLAAAKEVCGHDFERDHEADATCLSYLAKEHARRVLKLV